MRLHRISIDTFDLPFWLIKPSQDSGGAPFENEEEIRKQAQIYQKGQLTPYQQRINEVAGEICLHAYPKRQAFGDVPIEC